MAQAGVEGQRGSAPNAPVAVRVRGGGAACQVEERIAGRLENCFVASRD